MKEINVAFKLCTNAYVYTNRFVHFYDYFLKQTLHKEITQ
jgi:hypothetical protein